MHLELANIQDLCDAATLFAIDVLKPHGTLLMKFYTGPEDKALEGRLKQIFEKVKREKPEASRDESREMYFMCLKKRAEANRVDILKRI
jgi:21S rRNA (uridine2791-2'-O)-methyltransferase